MGSKRTVDVAGHMRKGRAVKAHDRVIDIEPEDHGSGATGKDLGGPLLEMAQADDEETTETISGVHYRGQHLGEGFARKKKIENCTFDDVTFTPMDFEKIEFVGCTFNSCEFTSVDFTNSEFRDCSFDYSKFYGKDNDSPWKDTHFSNCNFSNSEFLGVGMLYGGFKGCSFENFAIHGSRLNNIQILNSSIENSRITISDMSNTLFDQCQFEDFKMDAVVRRKRKGEWNATMSGDVKIFIHKSSLNRCSFEHSKMNGSNIIACELNDVKFDSVQLENVQFYNSTGSNIRFDVCSINKADFELSKFMDVTVRGSSLHYTSWKDAYLDCEFEGTTLPYYKQHPFEETFEESGLTKERFEFLVLAGAIEVRDNITLQKVSGGFDPDKHHIAPWVHENIKDHVGRLGWRHGQKT